MNRFPMAPMSRLILVLSLVLLLIPLGFFVHFVLYGEIGVLAIGGPVAAVFLAVALWARPSQFVVTGDALEIVFPLRRKRFPLSDIESAREIHGAQALKQEFGNLVRVGAGGFLGTFGILAGRRKGSLLAYTSRTDRWVLVERKSGRSLLISPHPPERFLEVLGQSGVQSRT